MTRILRAAIQLPVLSRSLRIIIAVLGCLHLCGGHWGALQVVAWARMIVDYSAQDGLVSGAAKTFDGAHPCCLCKAIAEGKKQESKEPKDGPLPQAVQKLVLKECLPGTPVLVPEPCAGDVVIPVFAELDLRGDRLGCRPPVPPPRRVA